MTGLQKLSGRIKNGLEYGVPKPPDQQARMKGVSLGRSVRGKKGFFVYTHRARSGMYPTPAAIPDSKVKFIESTG